MARTESLNDLFAEWEGSNPSYAENFSMDGIVDEQEYEKATRHILFILKEPNAHHEDLRDHARNYAEGNDRSNPTWRNLAYWSYGLLSKFPPFRQVYNDSKYMAVLHKIAVMNLKKTPGRSSAVPQEIAHFTQDRSNQDFIRREIGIIEPDVIIACGKPVDELTRKILHPKAEWSHSENDLAYLRCDSCVVVAYYHPAWRGVPEVMPYLYLVGELQKVLTER